MKIEKYLNSIKPKEFIYLMIAIPIVFFIIYNNFIYPMLEDEANKLNKTYKTTKKEFISTISKIRSLKNIDKILPPLEKKLQSDKEDYKYIKYALYDTPIILLDNKHFYMNLGKILDMSKKLNLDISINIDNSQKYPPFSSYILLDINGNGDYINILNFIKYIESLKVISYISTVNIALSSNDAFDYNKLFKKSVKNLSKISFTLTKYTQNELNILKKYGKHLKFTYSPNKNNSNYIDFYYVGNYSKISQIYNHIKSVRDEKIAIKNIKVHLKRNNSTDIDKYAYYFDIKINFMGIK